jgi:hypothetical protein
MCAEQNAFWGIGIEARNDVLKGKPFTVVGDDGRLLASNMGRESHEFALQIRSTAAVGRGSGSTGTHFDLHLYPFVGAVG